MFKLTIKSIRSNPARFLLTGVAVILGVAFMAGTLVLTDTIKQSYNNITANVYKSTDAVVRSSRHIEASHNGLEQRGTIDAALVETVRATPGVQGGRGPADRVSRSSWHTTARCSTRTRTGSVPIALGWQEDSCPQPDGDRVGSCAPRPGRRRHRPGVVRQGQYALGEKVHVLSQVGSTEFRLVGVVTYGGANSAVGGAQVVSFVPQTAARVLGTPGRVLRDPGRGRSPACRSSNW